MGLHVREENGKFIYVYRKDIEAASGKTYSMYSAKFKNSDYNGKTGASCYVTLRFKAGVEIPNKTKIMIKDAFPTVIEGYRDKPSTLGLFVLDFETEANIKAANVAGMDVTAIPDGVDEETPFFT